MKLKDSATITWSTEPEIFSVSALKNGAKNILMSLADLGIISMKKQESVSYSQKTLKEAAELLYEDYKNDRNLTEFSRLDGDD